MLKLRIDRYLAHPDAWNTDSIKLHFTGEQGKAIVITCHRGEKWIYDNNKPVPFQCKHIKPRVPEASLQMIRAHHCDKSWAGTDNEIKLHICKNAPNFNSSGGYPDSGNCCRSNIFSLDGSRTEWSEIDKLTDHKNDGGGALGYCEHFEFDTDKIFIGKHLL